MWVVKRGAGDWESSKDLASHHEQIIWEWMGGKGTRKKWPQCQCRVRYGVWWAERGSLKVTT